MMELQQGNLAECYQKEPATQFDAIMVVWKRLNPGEFKLSDLHEEVNELLGFYKRGISGSGLTAAMRKLRDRPAYDFNYKVINGKQSLYMKI